jgi:hypothetical protein
MRIGIFLRNVDATDTQIRCVTLAGTLSPVTVGGELLRNAGITRFNSKNRLPVSNKIATRS